jgi:hypothetical protein
MIVFSSMLYLPFIKGSNTESRAGSLSSYLRVWDSMSPLTISLVLPAKESRTLLATRAHRNLIIVALKADFQDYSRSHRIHGLSVSGDLNGNRTRGVDGGVCDIYSVVVYPRRREFLDSPMNFFSSDCAPTPISERLDRGQPRNR